MYLCIIVHICMDRWMDTSKYKCKHVGNCRVVWIQALLGMQECRCVCEYVDMHEYMGVFACVHVDMWYGLQAGIYVVVYLGMYVGM